MGNDKKPRICEVLGVEVGEVWKVDGSPYDAIYRVSSSGTLHRKGVNGKWRTIVGMGDLFAAINHPERIKRLARWTVEELEHAKTIKSLFSQAKYIQKERATFSVSVHDCTAQVVGLIYDEYDELFPHLKDNEAVALDEILEAETDGKDL